MELELAEKYNFPIPRNFNKIYCIAKFLFVPFLLYTIELPLNRKFQRNIINKSKSKPDTQVVTIAGKMLSVMWIDAQQRGSWDKIKNQLSS